jgi:hypothetical protein
MSAIQGAVVSMKSLVLILSYDGENGTYLINNQLTKNEK